MSKKTPITLAYGDGIGPEIMKATLHIIESAGAQIEIEKIEIGEKIYLQGHSSGILPEAWDSLKKTKVFLKAPITTPQGGGFKSLNVTVRKTLGLYANVRPCYALHPFVKTKHPDMNVIIIRENEEDLYAGVEYQHTPNVTQCLKLITRQGCEKIIRYAFEYALRHGRKKVTCFSKDNIMKITDGLFHKIFDSFAKEYPQIENEHWIVDIGAAKLADTPEVFDVIVTANLYGDILSDVAAQIAGSVGLAGSANIGKNFAMFEAIHGSAPRRAGQNMANPSGLLLAAIQMLVHIGQGKVASLVHNAWLKTIEDGIHTYDIYSQEHSQQKVGTQEFSQAVVDRLEQNPTQLKTVTYQSDKNNKGNKDDTNEKGTLSSQKSPKPTKLPERELFGVDVFLYEKTKPLKKMAQQLEEASKGSHLKLQMISSRGLSVWPHAVAPIEEGDHWRCRFVATGLQSNKNKIEQKDIIQLLTALNATQMDFIQTANLYTFDGKAGFSLGQGQ